MPAREHYYAIHLEWTGNTGLGTTNYRSYKRHFLVSARGKTSIDGSADPAFRGDKDYWNPEEMLVAAIAACHKLWYLHLCADAGVIVTAYEDSAEGIMTEDDDGGGRFRSVVLRPTVTVAHGSDAERAVALHDEAHKLCFIANSMNFPVTHEVQVQVHVA